MVRAFGQDSVLEAGELCRGKLQDSFRGNLALLGHKRGNKRGPRVAFYSLISHQSARFRVNLQVFLPHIHCFFIVSTFRDLHETSHLQATGRLKKNAAYFRVNYLAFMLVVTVTCMVLNPTSLIVLGCLALIWGYIFGIRTSPLVIGGRTFRWYLI